MSNHVLFGSNGRTKIEYLNFCIVSNFTVCLCFTANISVELRADQVEEDIKLTLSSLFRMCCNLGRSWVKWLPLGAPLVPFFFVPCILLVTAARHLIEPLLVCFVLRAEPGRRKKKKDTTWRIFSLKELQSATNNFNYDNKLGEGGFGSVYWGQLWDGSQVQSFSWTTKRIFVFYCVTVCTTFFLL